MQARAALALVGVAGLAALLLSDRASPVTVYDDGSAEIPLDAGDPVNTPGDNWAPGDDSYPSDAPIMTPEADPVASFLYMLRSCEHNALDVASGADYATFYGGSRFKDFSNHPVITGEKVGVPLPPAMCVAAGISSGKCVSTAAGGYQITVPTWRAYGLARGETDFSPEAQDRTAVRILDDLGATPAIERGDIETAIQLAGKRWASLPGALGGQSQKSIQFALAKFNEGQSGGAVTA